MLTVRVTVQHKYLFSTEHLIRLSSWYIIRHNNRATPTYCLIRFRMLMNSCLRLLSEQADRPTNGKIQTKSSKNKKKCCHYDLVFASIGRFVADINTLYGDLSEIINNNKKNSYFNTMTSARARESLNQERFFFIVCVTKTIATTAARIRHKHTFHIPANSYVSIAFEYSLHMLSAFHNN